MAKNPNRSDRYGTFGSMEINLEVDPSTFHGIETELDHIERRLSDILSALETIASEISALIHRNG